MIDKSMGASSARGVTKFARAQTWGLVADHDAGPLQVRLLLLLRFFRLTLWHVAKRMDKRFRANEAVLVATVHARCGFGSLRRAFRLRAADATDAAASLPSIWQWQVVSHARRALQGARCYDESPGASASMSKTVKLVVKPLKPLRSALQVKMPTVPQPFFDI